MGRTHAGRRTVVLRVTWTRPGMVLTGDRGSGRCNTNGVVHRYATRPAEHPVHVDATIKSRSVCSPGSVPACGSLRPSCPGGLGRRRSEPARMAWGAVRHIDLGFRVTPEAVLRPYGSQRRRCRLRRQRRGLVGDVCCGMFTPSARLWKSGVPEPLRQCIRPAGPERTARGSAPIREVAPQAQRVTAFHPAGRAGGGKKPSPAKNAQAVGTSHRWPGDSSCRWVQSA